MKITTTISNLIINHEVIKPEDKDNEVLITRVESVGPIIISENGVQRELTEKDGVRDLVEWLQKGAHNYISNKLS